MVQNLIAAFSLLIGMAGLTLSYAAHRQKVRQESQEYALHTEELEKFQRDRERERQLREQEQSARRQREQLQASMIRTNVVRLVSPLNSNWVVPRVVVQNRSNQLVRDVRVSFGDEVIGELIYLDTGEETFPLPPTESSEAGYQERIILEFTDIAGIRWRRERFGTLRRARPGTNGWEDPEPPVIEQGATGPRWCPAPDTPVRGLPAPPPPGPLQEDESRGWAPPGAAQRGTKVPVWRRSVIHWPSVVLVSVGLIAGGLWWFLHH
ncbi:hypothetical protein AB0D59_48295 [Streptomyces sp. NPDC048417]|uniref:hypothetical protein n=1 Tax=Streptomyces sp. NPDC048417 TaxID=3155387 RepID=UPI00341AFB8C